jgi:hypothetical protein
MIKTKKRKIHLKVKNCLTDNQAIKVTKLRNWLKMEIQGKKDRKGKKKMMITRKD